VAATDHDRHRNGAEQVAGHHGQRDPHGAPVPSGA
jgi:hypothetical protein